MSVLHDRITSQPSNVPGAGSKPVGTEATPMVMPMSEIAYAGNTALYGELHPLVMADGAVVPAYGHGHGAYADVMPAGRP